MAKFYFNLDFSGKCHLSVEAPCRSIAESKIESIIGDKSFYLWKNAYTNNNIDYNYNIEDKSDKDYLFVNDIYN